MRKVKANQNMIVLLGQKIQKGFFKEFVSNVEMDLLID